MSLNQLALLNLLERVLGKGSQGTRGNYKFICPFHISNPPGKKKLEINLETQEWSCWTCKNINNSKGKSIKSLFKKMNVNKEFFDELKLITNSTKTQSTSLLSSNNINEISLPEEFISLLDMPNDKFQKIQFKQAFNYLKSRKITKYDILKYNIGICLKGKYENRIIIPSYNTNGSLNYFVARDFTETQSKKYLNPPIKNRDIIGMELYINWNLPIILVEGPFDMLTLKRNCIPLFGKKISDSLYKKIVTSQVKKIYICLDNDAKKESLKYCEEMMKLGKEIYWIKIEDKDINKMGFKKFLEILENTSPLTFQDLINEKLNLI